ncbi:MAG: hypothetical protein VX899_09735 [Myxococcota bacterium]|nr:hypothetical protein [Myxococcota bacterium]
MLLLAVLACAAELEPVSGWPEAGCVSQHAPVTGHSLVSSQTGTLEGLQVGLLVPMEPGCYPAVVMVPPGIEAGVGALDESPAMHLAASGVVVAAYDPSGRGLSAGVEDYGGPAHREDLAQVLRVVAAREDVDPSRVWVLSRSYGVGVSAATLAGLTPQAAGLIDLEGPARLPEDLEHVDDQARQTLESAATGPDWYTERSAAEHIGRVPGHYLRIQALADHATGEWLGHALTLLNAAWQGEAASVRLNGQGGGPWEYEQVQAQALEGRVKLDDERVHALLLQALSQGID